MILDPKQTTVAYRCPHCGAGVMGLVGLFTLSADMIKLKCTCGESEMSIVYSKDGKVYSSLTLGEGMEYGSRYRSSPRITCGHISMVFSE